MRSNPNDFLFQSLKQAGFLLDMQYLRGQLSDVMLQDFARHPLIDSSYSSSAWRNAVQMFHLPPHFVAWQVLSSLTSGACGTGALLGRSDSLGMPDVGERLCPSPRPPVPPPCFPSHSRRHTATVRLVCRAALAGELLESCRKPNWRGDMMHVANRRVLNIPHVPHDFF